MAEAECVYCAVRTETLHIICMYVWIHNELFARSDVHLPASEIKRRAEGCIKSRRSHHCALREGLKIESTYSAVECSGGWLGEPMQCAVFRHFRALLHLLCFFLYKILYLQSNFPRLPCFRRKILFQIYRCNNWRSAVFTAVAWLHSRPGHFSIDSDSNTVEDRPSSDWQTQHNKCPAVPQQSAMLGSSRP